MHYHKARKGRKKAQPSKKQAKKKNKKKRERGRDPHLLLLLFGNDRLLVGSLPSIVYGGKEVGGRPTHTTRTNFVQ